MKRILMLLLALFAGGSLFVGEAEAQRGVQPKLRMTQLKWRTSAANAAGYVDSLTASIQGAIGDNGSVDTTEAWRTSDVFFPYGASTGSAFGCFKVHLVASSAANAVDTLFVTVETSADGTNWAKNTTFLNVIGTSGDEYLQLGVTCDSDLPTSTGSGAAWLTPYLRFRVRSDGNTAALFPGAQIFVSYHAWEND